jgi:hypothetical protein
MVEELQQKSISKQPARVKKPHVAQWQKSA